ncbi:MAG: DegT/DnrJ/EryC1/StrS family aminotransferase [Actinobacteria bacterium]|nr:DegT/DnrJ/EryC1/StrS family aminotransferase [Actinomycetota bacterium]
MRVDLRSDTVTSPSADMREVMAQAPVGDDVYGEDATVNSLEERIAELFGKEAAVFTPSGSLANQLGIRSLVSPGQELITEENSHIVRAELGAAAVFSGITTRTWRAERGLLRAADAMEIARPNSGPYLVSTAAIAVENTHNFGGGTVQPIAEIAALSKLATESGLTMHLDGARIWNAHIASGVALHEYAKYFDTVSVCLSKGLGAPVGSLLLSTKERIIGARVWRKRYGAGMRQIGILAAAGHFALDTNLGLLADDHRRARFLAQECQRIDASIVNPNHVDTNIVCLDLSQTDLSATEFAEMVKTEGVLISALGPRMVRAVTHLDINDEQINYASEVIKLSLQRAFMSK